MRKRVLVQCVCVLLSAGRAMAQEPAADDQPAYWLDEAARAVDRVRAQSPVDLAYEQVDIYFQLTLTEAAAGRQTQALARLGKLRGGAAMISLMAQDNWAMSLLPAALTATGQDADLKLTLAMLNEPAAQLDAAIGLAEAYHMIGDDKRYLEQVQRILELQPKAQAEYLELAGSDPHFEFDGTYAGWFAMAVFRDRNDLAAARKLAELEWKDPVERAGVLAVLAQLEASAGNAQKASDLIDGVREGLAEGAKKQAKHGDAYYADLDTHLPEAVAAVHVTSGPADALRLGETYAQPHTIWKRAAWVHAATALRRRGDVDAARGLADQAAALPLPGPDASATYDAKHLCRELVRQGRLAQAKVYAARLDDPTHRAYACLGVAQGLLAKPAGQPDQ